jgi:Tol biopolymer transport system component
LGGGARLGSYDPSWDGSGTKIAFASDSDFLGQGLPAGQREIWLYNTSTMTYTRVTSATGSGSRISFFPSLSADGRTIAFNSDADFLTQGIPATQLEIWLYRSLDKQIYLPVVFKKSS